jgi:Sensors of blue-light using FAD
MDSLAHCIWSSKAAEDFDDAALLRLVAQARIANEQAGITGMLLYSRGCFFQVLEGRPGAVDMVFDRIYADARHIAIAQLIFEPIAQRAFGDWSMGYADVSEAEIASVVGRDHPFGTDSCLANLDGASARRLREAFVSSAYRTRLTQDASSRTRSA